MIQSVNFVKKQIILVLLGLILVFAGFLRFYKLAENPPSISWDEAAVGYNAWSILNWGKDEWGKTLPLAFRSFGEYKLPVNVYFTGASVLVFGLNELGVRASSAFFGILNVLMIYFLGAKIFRSKWIGVISALVLAISPYNLHFSRFNHELNFAIFFFMLGFYLFLKSLNKKSILLIFSFVAFGVSLISYNAAKIVVPPVLLLLIVLYLRKLLQIKKYFFLGLLTILFFAVLVLIEPNLLGMNRFKETSSVEDRKVENILRKYKAHYSFDFLFVKGDSNPRLSSQVTGEFYKTDLPFLFVGLTALLWFLIKDKRKELLVVLAWALLAPLPATITSEAPHAARAMFMTGSWHLILALGVYTILNLFKNKYLKLVIVLVVIGVLGKSFADYWQGYFDNYKDRYAIEWQYGMKEVVEYVEAHPEYDEVYMTAERQQPYIFYLFYLKTPLPSYLKTVRYNETLSKSANSVASFSKFHFGLWDEIESLPIPHILYIVTPSSYTGLRHRLLFDTLSEIKYPNGTSAFYLVAAKIYE